MFFYSLSGTFPLACTLCLYSAGKPNSAPIFKVGVQCTGAVVDNNSCWQNAFEKINLANFQSSGSWKYNLYFPVEVTRNIKDYFVYIVDGVVEQKELKVCVPQTSR